MSYIIFAIMAIISAVLATFIVNKITFFDQKPKTKWIIDITIFFALYFSGLAIFENYNAETRFVEQSKQMVANILNKQNLEVGAVELLSKEKDKIIWKAFTTSIESESYSAVYFCRSTTKDGMINTSCTQNKANLNIVKEK